MPYPKKISGLLSFLLLISCLTATVQTYAQAQEQAYRDQIAQEAREARRIQEKERQAEIRLISRVAIGVILVVSGILITSVVIIRKRNDREETTVEETTFSKPYKILIDNTGDPLFVNKVWRDVRIVTVGLGIWPLVMWGLSRVIPHLTGWEWYTWVGLFILVGVLPFAIGHAWKLRRRFVVRSQGLAINYQLQTWDTINKLEITQASAPYPELILYRADQKEAHPLVLGQSGHEAFTELLQQHLGDKLHKIYQPKRPQYKSMADDGYDFF